MLVKTIADEEYRLLLYGISNEFHVIANHDEKIFPGDVIEYEPYGINFGWFVKRVKDETTNLSMLRVRLRRGGTLRLRLYHL